MSARRSLVVAATALVLLGAGAVAVSATSSSVEVLADGEARTTRTFAADVAAVLDRLDIEVGPADRVEPAPDTSLRDTRRIVVTRAKTVDVHVGDESARTVVGVVDTVADVLLEADLGDLLEREARIDPPPTDLVVDGGRIDVELPVDVTITVDGEDRHVDAFGDTVAETLDEAGVDLGERDLVDPAPDHPVEEATHITVQRVEVVEEVAEVTIERDEQQRETDDLVEGDTEVEAEGEDGLRHETYDVTLVDGEETERELVAEEVVREPTDRVVLVGTAPGPVRRAQTQLAELGYPVGTVDGIDGPQTRRALCSWRRLEGHDVSRESLQPGELEALEATSGLPTAESGRGVTVDRTCQTLYYREDGRWRDVHAASTGADGLPREGDYRIQRTREGWHTSTLFPSPTPNMYNSMYFRGAIAIHGSNTVPPHPASAGCVRVTPESADRLFADLGVGDPVRVIGSY